MAALALKPIDLAIIAGYVALTVGVGFWISRRASKNLRSYFLGGNQIPWYALGLSNASGMFDISGTMLMVGWLYVYGLKSAWIPWVWPVFNQVVMMVYLSVWLRRSRVLTGAEWIRFRFGNGAGAQASHMVVVVFAMLAIVSLLAYGFLGIGKFVATFMPASLALSADAAANETLYAVLVTAVTTLYVVKGGMFSVVFTEVLQFFIMSVACVAVGVIAMQQVSPAVVEAAVPDGWRDIWFGWELGLDWSGRLEAANAKIAEDGWRLFSVFVGLALLKGVLASAAGPTPGYDMQRVLATRTPREAAMMSGVVSLVLLVPRYMLITGLTVLALAYFGDELASGGDQLNFERLLPLVMRDHVPHGLLGLLIAALLAAFMSTYAATVNSAPAYLVNDIYKRYINPQASDRTLVWLSYAASAGVVVAGVVLGLTTKRLEDIVNWLVAALYGGYIASNVLKWHWWRFNGWGYFWGMTSGILAAMVVSLLDSTLLTGVGTVLGVEKNLALFPVLLVITSAACVAGSLLTPPDDMAVLKEFYRRVRPWGVWGPVRDALQAEHPGLQPNRDFFRDAINVAIGIAWQTALTATGIYLVLRDYRSLAVSVAVVLATSLLLKLNWYDRLQDFPDHATAD